MIICGNEIADELVREGGLKGANNNSCLTFLEIASCVKWDINAFYKVDPVYERYACNRLGAALSKGNIRRIEIDIAIFGGGHLCVQHRLLRIKVSPLYPQCNIT